MDDMSAYPRHRRRPDWRALLVVISVLAVAGILVAYGAAGSYESLSQLAARHMVPFPRFAPVGIDGALVGFLVIDMALTLWGRPVFWLHQVVRLFCAATIWFNFRAGWPDTIGAGFRIMAPALLVILSEVLRVVILRNQRQGERIPWKRWVLDLRGTFRLWRRMQLWRIADYQQAVDMELSRLRAIEQLRHRFGETWEKKVPGDLSWMLAEGVRMGEAITMVGELCAPPQALPQPAAGTSGKRQSPARRKRSAGGGAPDIDRQAQALAEFMKNPQINGSQMAVALGVSPSRGRWYVQMARESAPATGPLPRVTAG